MNLPETKIGSFAPGRLIAAFPSWRRRPAFTFQVLTLIAKQLPAPLMNVIDGEVLHITKVSRLHMGAYLCIASNGVPPSISKRVMLRVQFPPMLSIPNQLEGAYIGQDVSLECHTEAYPTSINYWTTERGDMIVSGDKYEAVSMDNGYNKYMMLKIRSVEKSDFGSYQCVAKNSLGETDGMIKLDEIPAPSTTTTEMPTTTPTVHKKKGPRNSKKWKHSENQILEDYDLEEWRDTEGEDYSLPSIGPPEGVTRSSAATSRSEPGFLWCSALLCSALPACSGRSAVGPAILTAAILLLVAEPPRARSAFLLPDAR
ncbi:IgLON family member 5 [Nesidiocoris tenuis]|uniref:IgLON family member 5 n=1 Tax=Nesidiocoris tenuis TaxID=355587 RepID=A0ABN7AN81_9HEMI|nr:IgLON family member 5 [Nesidiocoris tenuis]